MCSARLLFQPLQLIRFYCVLSFLLVNHNFNIPFSEPNRSTSSSMLAAEAAIAASRSLICRTHPRYCEMRNNPLPACFGACSELQEYRVKDREACVRYCKRHFGWRGGTLWKTSSILALFSISLRLCNIYSTCSCFLLEKIVCFKCSYMNQNAHYSFTSTIFAYSDFQKENKLYKLLFHL